MLGLGVLYAWHVCSMLVCAADFCACQCFDWHKRRYMSWCWKYISGILGEGAAFWLDTWAAIHNECFPATYLTSWTPALQVLSLNKNCVFWPIKTKSVFLWRCQTHNEVCHPYLRGGSVAVEYCWPVCACRECFQGLDVVNAARLEFAYIFQHQTMCDELFSWIPLNPTELFLEELRAAIWQVTEASGYLLTT